MKKIWIKASALMVVLFFTNTAVRAQNAAEVEGPISAVTDNGDGTGIITVMGMTIQIPATATITSPTVSLTMDQLADPTPFPGRTQAGFIGGTAIVVGTVDAVGQLTAQEVFAEPSENVLLGIVTSNAPDPLTVNNVPITFLSDTRMPAGPALNDLGVEVVVDDLAVGTIASVEGYYDGSTFQTFLLEAEGAAAAVPTPQVGIVRAQGRTAGGRLEVRGGLTGITGSETLELRNAANNALLAVLTVQEAPFDGVEVLVAGTAQFRFQVRGLRTVPATVRVVNLTSPSEATAEVDIR